jgi:6-phosphogluconate dehydrogenase
MGASLVARIMAAGHECVVYDSDPGAVAASARAGVIGAESLADLATRLRAPRGGVGDGAGLADRAGDR